MLFRENDDEQTIHQLAADSVDIDTSTNILTRTGDAILKGGLGAAVSGTMSIVNSFVDTDTTGSVEDIIGRIGGESSVDYYQNNKEILDTIGFIGSTVATYGGGVLALKLARAGFMPNAISRSLRILPDGNRKALKNAMDALTDPGRAMTAKIAETRQARLAWATADNILTATAGEAMTVAVLQDHPMMEGYSAGDFALNAFGFGALGGGAEFLAGRTIVRKAASTIDMQALQFSDLKNYEKLGLKSQNEITQIADDLTKLGSKFDQTPFQYSYGGKKEAIMLDTGKLFESTRDQAMKTGLSMLEKKMNDLAGGNVNVGQAFAKRVTDVLTSMGDDPQARIFARDEIAGLMAPIGRLVSNTELDTLAEEGAAIYLRRKPDVVDPRMFDSKFSPGDTLRAAYQLAEGVKEKDLVTAAFGGQKYKTSAEAFADGVDVFYNKAGFPVVNPKSEKIAKVADELNSTTGVVHIESGDWSFDPIYTAGDNIKNPNSDVMLGRHGDAIIIGKKEFKMGTKSVPLDHGIDTVQSSARYIWASKLGSKDLQKFGSIDARDLPMLDRLVELAPEMKEELKKITVELSDGSKMLASDIPDLAKFAKQQKQGWIYEYNKAGFSEGTKTIAVHTNTSMKFVDEVIASGYALPVSHEGGLLRTVDSMQPRTVGARWDNQEQFFRGTDTAGNKIKGALMQRLTTDWKPTELMRAIGGHLTRTADEFEAATKTPLPEAAGENAFMRSSMDPVTGQWMPKVAHVDKVISDQVKKITGLREAEIIAHEVGHALDFWSAAKQNLDLLHHQMVDPGNDAFKAFRDELWQTSKKFRPTQWTTQPNYVKQGAELFADNFAMWMTRPEERKNMKMFAMMWGEQLDDYEMYFKQSVWKRTNGPAFGADAMLAHEYEIQMRTLHANNAVKSVMGSFADALMPNSPKLAKTIDSLGSGPTTWSSANAGYSERERNKLWAQHTGTVTRAEKARLRDEVSGALRPYMQAISRDPVAAAELSMVTTAVRRTDAPYYQMTSSVGNETRSTFVTQAVKDLVDKGEELQAAIAKISAAGQQASLPIKSRAVEDFLVQHMRLNAQTQDKLATLHSALGLGKRYDPQRLYIPPIDTQRYPYVAFVKQKAGVGASNEVAMITAKSADQLRQLMSQVDTKAFNVYDKTDVKNFFEAKGAYDYSQAFNDSRVSNALRKEGKLGDFFPETRGELVLADFGRFHTNQQDHLVNTAVQTQYAELFGQLKYLSDDYTRAETSIARGRIGTLLRKVEDPYGDIIKTALDMQKMGEFPLLDSLNEFVDIAGRKVYNIAMQAWRRADAGMIPYEQANEMATRYGLGSVADPIYKNAHTYQVANEIPDKNAIALVSSKMNRIMANMGLRLDFANSLVNILSTPIMLGMEHSAIKNMAKKDPEVAGALAALYSTDVPGQNMKVPSYSKLMFNAIGNYFKDDGRLMARYKPIAGLDETLQDHKMMLDEMAPAQWKTWDVLNKTADKWVDKAAVMTGNTFSEKFTRFISADVMRQQTDILENAGMLSRQEADAYIMTFTNRVQGNYVQSQRPLLFQGTAGRSISLFQTYMFNVAQQLLRHVGDRNGKAVLTFGALQSSIYGLQGLPYFEAVNSTLIAGLGSNPERKDAYSELTKANDDVGKWLLYGTASALPLFDGQGPALYTRGDLNPRTLIGLPTSPMDIPAVSGVTRLVGTIKQFASSVRKEGDVENAMLLALEHQGLSRPLAGFAQLVSGRQTTSKGSLISAASDLNVTAEMSGLFPGTSLVDAAVRLSGAKPLDTSIAINQMYRSAQYTLEDQQRIESLGQAVKTRLYNNQVPTDEELQVFLEKYVASGGAQKNFSKAMQRWMKDANQSVVNQTADKLSNKYAQRLQVMLGGEELLDYRNAQLALERGQEIPQPAMDGGMMDQASGQSFGGMGEI